MTINTPSWWELPGFLRPTSRRSQSWPRPSCHGFPPTSDGCRNPEWYGLDIAYKPIKLGSELKEDSSDSTDWGWTKDIKPKYTKIAPNIYQYGDGSLPRIKVVFKRVEDGEIKTNVIEFDDYEFLDSEEYMNRHFILMGVDDEDNDWLVDGIAYLIGGGEYEWDVNWDSIENNS